MSMASLIRRTFFLFCILTLFADFPSRQPTPAFAAPPLQVDAPPACRGAVVVPLSDAPCKDMQIIFLVDDSGSMGRPWGGNDTAGQRFTALENTVDQLAEVYLSELEAGARELPKIEIAAVHFATRIINNPEWVEIVPQDRDAWDRGEYRGEILERLTGPEVRNLSYNTNPDRRTDFRNPFRAAADLFDQTPLPDDVACPNRLIFLLTDGAPDEGQGELHRFFPPSRAEAALHAHFAEVRDQVARLNSPVTVLAFRHSDRSYWDASAPYWQDGIATEALQVELGNGNEDGATPNLLDTVRYKVEQQLVGATVSVPAYLSALQIAYSAPQARAHLEVLDPQGSPLVPVDDKVVLVGEGTLEQTWTVQNPPSGDYLITPLDDANAPLPGGSIRVEYAYPAFESGLELDVVSPPLQQFTRGDISFLLSGEGNDSIPVDSQHPPKFIVSFTPLAGETEMVDISPKDGVFRLAEVLPVEAGTGTLTVSVVVEGFDGNECVLHRMEAENAYQVIPVRVVIGQVQDAACTPSAMPVRIPLTLVDSNGEPARINLPVTWQVLPAHENGNPVEAEVVPKGDPDSYELRLDTPFAGLIQTELAARVEYDGRTYPLSVEPVASIHVVPDQEYSFEPLPAATEYGSSFTRFSRWFRQESSVENSSQLLPRRFFGALGRDDMRIHGRFINQETGEPVAGIERFMLDLVPGVESAPRQAWLVSEDGTYFVTFAEPPLGDYQLLVTDQRQADPCTSLIISNASLTLVPGDGEYILLIFLILTPIVSTFLAWVRIRRLPGSPVWFRRKSSPRPAVRPEDGDRGTLAQPEDKEKKEDEEDKEADDLTEIEGIGLKVADVLKEAGITTFEELALASFRMAEIRARLRARGYHYMYPDTWPEQAQLAASGDKEALDRLKAKLKGGRPVDADEEEKSS